MSSPIDADDGLSILRRYTPARVAIGRAGGSLPTAQLLDFAIKHAAARDAVNAPFDASSLRDALAPSGLDVVLLKTRAQDRQAYLQRPDLGRRLDAMSVAALRALPERDADVVFILADGLSAPAAQRHGPSLMQELLPMLRSAGVQVGPIAIVTNARVAVEDEIGAELRAKVAVILLGERPGLGAADSLGAYLVYDPRLGRSDAERNCVSNIRPDGLPPARAAATLHYLIRQSLSRRISGVSLKDERDLQSAIETNRA
jgi:ethanolamine ammonia-lyase small subunit